VAWPFARPAALPAYPTGSPPWAGKLPCIAWTAVTACGTPQVVVSALCPALSGCSSSGTATRWSI